MIRTYQIESEAEADDYLKDLLARKEFRSMSEVNRRSSNLINDENLRKYFIEKAKSMLEFMATTDHT